LVKSFANYLFASDSYLTPSKRSTKQLTQNDGAEKPIERVLKETCFHCFDFFQQEKGGCAGEISIEVYLPKKEKVAGIGDVAIESINIA
jgi:hypothetical protein